MPILLLLIIAAISLFDSYIPLAWQQVMYAMSLTVKAGIVFILPILIFNLLFKTMVELAGRATTIIFLILICVCCSNYLATFMSHYVGEWVYQFDLSMIQPQTTHTLTPAWTIQLPKLIENNVALFSGIISGILLGTMHPQKAIIIANVLEKVTSVILASFKFAIPIFLAGFFLKLKYDGVISLIVHDYALILTVIVASQMVYLFLVYFVLNNFKLSAALNAIKNMLPAAISGFSAMSSAAVMPLTIDAVAKNTSNKDIARAVVPCTVNIHLMGDCIAIPIFAYAMMKSFGIATPDLLTYSVFVFYFVLAKFSVAAVPGGGIIVMLPILEAYLGFTPEMLSLMTAVYILFDSVITCANILGNGALAMLIDKLMSESRETVRA